VFVSFGSDELKIEELRRFVKFPEEEFSMSGWSVCSRIVFTGVAVYMYIYREREVGCNGLLVV
jgi:hypothetical protein